MDWTLLRLFPPRRATWALMGTQAVVPITGANAKRVLFGAIDLRTAHRIVLIRCHARQADAQAFLSELRRRYRRASQIWLLADRASAHTELWPKSGDGGLKGGVSRRVTSLPEPPGGAIRRDER